MKSSIPCFVLFVLTAMSLQTPARSGGPPEWSPSPILRPFGSEASFHLEESPGIPHFFSSYAGKPFGASVPQTPVFSPGIPNFLSQNHKRRFSEDHEHSTDTSECDQPQLKRYIDIWLPILYYFMVLIISYGYQSLVTDLIIL
jgi:hypothetical protein